MMSGFYGPYSNFKNKFILEALKLSKNLNMS